MKNKKLFKIISNITFGIGSAIAIYAIITTFITQSNLPPGVCPIDNGRPLIYVSIGFLVVSLITSFLSGKDKNDKKDSEQDS